VLAIVATEQEAELADVGAEVGHVVAGAADEVCERRLGIVAATNSLWTCLTIRRFHQMAGLMIFYCSDACGRPGNRAVLSAP
jgi:hypothetical protein